MIWFCWSMRELAGAPEPSRAVICPFRVATCCSMVLAWATDDVTCVWALACRLAICCEACWKSEARFWARSTTWVRGAGFDGSWLMASHDCQKVREIGRYPRRAGLGEDGLGPLEDLLQGRALGQDPLRLLGVGGQQLRPCSG